MNSLLPIFKSIDQSPHKAQILNDHHLLGIFKDPTELKKQWIHNEVLLSELKEIGESLTSSGSKASILKGTHLILELYPDSGSRFISDVDILISPENYRVLENILLKAHFVELKSKKFHGNHFKSEWIKKVGNIEVNLELHTKLFFHLDIEDWNYVPSKIKGFSQLSLEDLFIHLCGHLAFQHTFIKLYWLVDIFYFVEKYHQTLDWELIIIRSKTLHLYQSVLMSLWCLNQYFVLDAKIVSRFSLNRWQWWHKFLSINFLLAPDQYRFHYLVIKHATKDSLIEALKYDLTWFWHYKILKMN